jgi:hypothetical protein
VRNYCLNSEQKSITKALIVIDKRNGIGQASAAKNISALVTCGGRSYGKVANAVDVNWLVFAVRKVV